MGLFDEKTALVVGVANRGSIAWGIARALREEGARLGFSYAAPAQERRVRPLAESVDAELIEQCDVTDDAALDRLFARVGETFGTLHVLVHAVAFAPSRSSPAASPRPRARGSTRRSTRAPTPCSR